MKVINLIVLAFIATACQKPKEAMNETSLRKKIEAFAPVEITVDMSSLSPRQIELVKTLVQASQYADQIFWKQTSFDANSTRQMLLSKNDAASKEALEYVMINYGPYDREDRKRFVGEGPAEHPDGAAFYPADMTKVEFEKFVKENPAMEKELTGLYTVIVRDGGQLKAVPYHEMYNAEVTAMAELLKKASEHADNESLKNYLAARAIAVTTDDYYDSDLLWMQLKDNDVDVVIGPIENYEDNLFNYKAAYEAAVMIKDPKGTADLQVFKSHIDALEQNLPEKKEYIRKTAGKGNVLEVVNIAYFAGDFQKGIKTIAASLPNDSRVTEKFGGKKQMYKNIMEAKFNTILVPIGQKLVAEEFQSYIDRDAFTTFVTMHEVSHTLGRQTVFGDESKDVRMAMKDLHSAIEEAKADVLGIYNMDYFHKSGMYNDEEMKKFYVTYLAGLFRSIRFGAEEAHGKANIAQMVYLKEKGALGRNDKGQWVVHFDKFQDAVASLAKTILELQAEGNYDGAQTFLTKYGALTDDIKGDLGKLLDIPRDLNTSYSITNKL